MSNLDPSFTVGAQLIYGLREAPGSRSRTPTPQLIATCSPGSGIDDPERVMRLYPHEISGGMAQRVLICGAVASGPDSSSPTSRRRRWMSPSRQRFSSSARTEQRARPRDDHRHPQPRRRRRPVRHRQRHEGRPHRRTQRVDTLFALPSRTYTRDLLTSLPLSRTPGGDRTTASEQTRSRSSRPRRPLSAGAGAARPSSKDVSLDLRAGETVSLVGESGSGKTTIGRAILGLAPVTGGTITFRGQEISNISRTGAASSPRDIQVIFQDPYSSLNPSMTVESILVEPLRRPA